MSERQLPSTFAKVELATARSTWLSNSAFSSGLIRKPNAPHWVASTASGMVAWAVTIMTVIDGHRLFSSLSSFGSDSWVTLWT
jgi:hypothetical protein